MSSPYQSPYQVLDNRPLDQWKVTELKEELRKRRLTIKGLKEDLVKRLDEAVRLERESAPEESESGGESESDNGLRDSEPPQSDTAGNLGGSAGYDGENTGGSVVEETVVEEDTVVETTVTTVETSFLVTESVEPEVQEIKGSENSKAQLGIEAIETRVEKDIDDSKTQLEGNENSEPRSEKLMVDSPAPLENQVSELVSENSESRGESKTQLEINNNSEPKSEEVTLGDSATDNQVYEVSPNLGSPVKCDSISTDSVSINEKIEIKDNIIADNVKLELDNVKPSTVVPVGGESHPHPMDVEEPHPHGEKAHGISDTDADLSKKFDSLDDVGDSEKLNLDRSSGDESMEEDVLDSKQVDSKYRLDDEIMSEKIEVSEVKKEGGSVDIAGDHTEKKAMDVVNNDRPFAPAEKRKLNDQTLVGNTENVKRQRRWNTESIKVPEPQNSNITLSTTPKDTFQSPASKGLSKLDPVITNDAPKERVVPPSPKPPTNSLKVDRFVRPFTLKAVQELLGKTGNVVSFWMDRIKTHCYVTYSSVEEAVETRDALYNLQWPPNGGRNLTAEFVEPQEVKTRLETPPSAPSPATTPGGSQPQLRQMITDPPPPPPPSLLPPPPLANPHQARERLPLPPPPPVLEEESNLDPPIVTLDDLFRKTKASPRIYYLPLSDEQVAARAAAKQ